MYGIASRKPGIQQTRRYALVLAGTFAVALAAMVFIGKAAAQSGEWQLVRAEYGFRSQRVDVTDVVRHLLWEARETGRVPVNNQTMGGDPVVGADKTLRITAENRRHERQEFDYAEGAWIDVTLFSLRPDRRDGDGWRDGDRSRDNDRIRDRDGDGRQDDISLRERGDRDRDRRRDEDDHARPAERLQIVRGYWGAQGQMVNITDKLQAMVRNGVLQVHVDNIALGGDPAIGRDKVLIVLYNANGKEQAASTKEGNTMHIP
jgi:hypothetical protein